MRHARKPGSTCTALVCIATVSRTTRRNRAGLKSSSVLESLIPQFMMPRPNPTALTALLALLTGIAPMSVDMYLASLPDIARNLTTSDARVQLTLSFYLVGFAIGQVIWGPISDRRGRRPILLTAIAVFIVASIVCTIAPS